MDIQDLEDKGQTDSMFAIAAGLFAISRAINSLNASLNGNAFGESGTLENLTTEIASAIGSLKEGS